MSIFENTNRDTSGLNGIYEQHNLEVA